MAKFRMKQKPTKERSSAADIFPERTNCPPKNTTETILRVEPRQEQRTVMGRRGRIHYYRDPCYNHQVGTFDPDRK